MNDDEIILSTNSNVNSSHVITRQPQQLSQRKEVTRVESIGIGRRKLTFVRLLLLYMFLSIKLII